MGPVDLRFDVTAALPAEVTQGATIEIAAWLFFPDDPALIGPHPVATVLTSGGSYDKRYHHAVIPGHPGYSAAEHLAALGHIVLLTDHLGMGGSSRVPNQKLATRQIVALANHTAVSQFYGGLAAGELHPGLPALPACFKAGGGHSMGAMLAVIQQAKHGTYDALLVLGYTAQGVHGTINGRKFAYADLLPKDGGEAPDYTRNDRKAQRENFHWRDVPEAVMLADDALAVETPSQIGRVSIESGIITAEAAQIEVPILLGLGERDVSPDPEAEAHCFGKCPDFTLTTLPRSAHCQSFAGTRHLFWNQIDTWAKDQAKRASIGSQP